ncbi:hypothetical protein [Sulfurivermis fontis]|uniref:hypothetical protein n=1 Tax=Sulfurivermis fontis TaxID=1972068 RepID=UPI000FD7DE04|nr:hypothetical protein [Sulfurivermis fontis]
MRMIAARQLLVLLAGIAMVANAHGADDAYLKALQAETQAITSGEAAGAAAQPPAAAADSKPQAWSASGQGLAEELPVNLSQEQFEAALKSSYFGTFVFYNKLTDADKAKVYEEYKANAQISHIRDTTTNLLKK